MTFCENRIFEMDLVIILPARCFMHANDANEKKRPIYRDSPVQNNIIIILFLRDTPDNISCLHRTLCVKILANQDMSTWRV